MRRCLNCDQRGRDDDRGLRQAAGDSAQEEAASSSPSPKRTSSASIVLESAKPARPGRAAVLPERVGDDAKPVALARVGRSNPGDEEAT
jgi:hypothetical protein